MNAIEVAGVAGASIVYTFIAFYLAIAASFLVSPSTTMQRVLVTAAIIFWPLALCYLAAWSMVEYLLEMMRRV